MHYAALADSVRTRCKRCSCKFTAPDLEELTRIVNEHQTVHFVPKGKPEKHGESRTRPPGHPRSTQ